MLFIDERLIAQVDSENGKTAVSIPTDHKLSKLTPSSSSFNTEPPRYAAHYDYSAADDNEVFFIFYSYIFIIFFTLYIILYTYYYFFKQMGNKGSLTIYHNCIIVYKCAVVANLKNYFYFQFYFQLKKIGCL